MKIVVVSGGFDPIHSGHIAYLEEAKKLGDKLIVALNSDDWLIKKKGKFFVLLSTLLKISLIALITVFLVEYLSLDLIGFLSGFSVILIVFILLIQDK